MYVRTDGPRVRELRQNCQLGAAAFARMAGASLRTLTRVERNEGPVTLRTARKIGAALGADPRTFAKAVSRLPA